MILKGNQRGGGQQLAAHLMNSFTNESVEVAEVRGTIAHDLSGAFAEIYAHSLSTKAEQPYYHMSINPDQSQRRLTREEYFEVIARTERSLKLIGQPRAVVFHEIRDDKGELRQHCHVVWSRILTAENKAVNIHKDRNRLRRVAQNFARDHGFELPDGLKKDHGRDRHKRRAREENLTERQQRERTGVGKPERTAEITECWTGSADGPGFVAALEAKGYTLARGERHGKKGYCLIDLYGEVHSFSRYVEVASAREIRARLQPSHPLESLPSVDDARSAARQKLAEIKARVDSAHRQQQKSAIDARRDGLAERQGRRRAELDRQRLEMFGRHFAERGALRQMQADEIAGVLDARSEKQPKGMAGFLTRITGVGKLVAWAQGKIDQKREAEHRQQAEALSRRHGREVKEMDRHYAGLDRLEKRENRSAATAALRETYRSLRDRSAPLKPEFDKALTRQEPPVTSGGDARRFAGIFTRLAEGVGFTKGDLQAAFERAHNGKTAPKGDGDGGRAPDQDAIDRAHRLREDFERRQTKDRDKDHER